MSSEPLHIFDHGDALGDFYLEAVAPTDVADPGARQRAAVLLDGVDVKLENANYWLYVLQLEAGWPGVANRVIRRRKAHRHLRNRVALSTGGVS